MLMKQNIDVPFTGGIDEKTDDPLVVPTKVTSLINGRFSDKKTIRSRGGFRPLVTGTAYTGDDPSTPIGVFKHRNDVLVESAKGVHLADIPNNKWKQVATSLNRCAVSLQEVFHGSGYVWESDVAGDHNYGIRVIVYASNKERTNAIGVGGANDYSRVYLCVIQNGVEIRHERLDTNGIRAVCPRVVYSEGNGKFYIYWGVYDTGGAGATGIYGTTLSVSSPGATLTKTLVSSAWSVGAFDVSIQPHSSGGTSVFLAFNPTGTKKIRCMKLSGTDGVTSLVSQLSADVTVNNIIFVATSVVSAVAGTRAGYFAYAVTDTPADGLILAVGDLDNFATPAVDFTTLVTGATLPPVGRVATMIDPNNTARTWVAWETNTQGLSTARIAVCSHNVTAFAAPVVSADFSPVLSARSVGIASGIHYKGRSVYIGAMHYSLTQTQHHEIEIGRTVNGANTAVSTAEARDTCARVDLNGAFVYAAVAAYTTAPANYFQTGGTVYPAQVSHTVVSRHSNFTCKQRGNGDRVVVTAQDVTPLGLDVCDFFWKQDSTTGVTLNHVEVSECTVLAGGNPQLFDGESLAELGFEQYPESGEVTIALTGAGTGFSAGTYGFVFVFEWYDRQGNRHQSRPSVPVSKVIAANDTMQVTVPTLRITRKQNVSIVMYATEADGTLYYRVPLTRSGARDPLGFPNDTTADTVISSTGIYFVNNDINTGELLYTTGGVLPNSPYPACKHVAVAQDRLWMAGSEDNQARYTDVMTAGFFPSTNEVYTFETDTGGGRLSAIEALDDKIVILQESRLSTVYGRGPNRLGLDNQFSPVTPIAARAGHSWRGSDCVVSDPDGLWFRDTMGLRHLSRGLQLSVNPETGALLGSEMDESVRVSFDGSPAYPRAAVFHRDQNQVRFCNGANSGALVYDVLHKQWSTYTAGPEGISGIVQFYDAIVLPAVAGLSSLEGSVWVSLDSDGQLYYESKTVTQDAPVGRDSRQVVTTVVTAWIKLANLMGFQRIYRAHILGELGASGASYASNGATLQITPAYNYNFEAVSVTAPTFSAWSGFAGTSNRFQIEHQFVQQKCAAIQITLAFTSTTTSTGWVRLTGMTLQVGLKKGTFKNSASRRF